MAAKKASRKRTAKRTAGRTLNAENLTYLGAPRLAELLVQLTASDTAAKRRLRLELAAAHSPEAVARLVRTRLGSLAKAETNIAWKAMPALTADMRAHHEAIAHSPGKENPALALELWWLFLAAAASIRDRCGFDCGLGELHQDAMQQLGAAAAATKPDPGALAESAFRALVAGHGRHLPIIPALAPVLGPAGLARLKERLTEHDSHSRSGREPLLAIADAEGDVDEYLRLHPAGERTHAHYSAEIAQRLLAAGRAEEALRTLDAATGGADATNVMGRPHYGWADTRIKALESLGRHQDAQDQRWACFDRALSIPHLRAWLRQFPNTFDAMDAEERAFDHAERFHPTNAVLLFFIQWPDLKRASALVLRQAKEFEGGRSWVHPEIAEALAAHFPLAAILLLRSALEFRLNEPARRRMEARQNEREAARLFKDCAGLAPAVADFGAHPDQDGYVSRLRKKHPYAYDFWSEVKKTQSPA